MSGAPRINASRRDDRPSTLRIVMITILVCALVLAAGFVAGLLLGRQLL